MKHITKCILVVENGWLWQGLGESVDQVWSGDVDLADGALQEQYRCYLDRLKFVLNFGLADAALQLADDFAFIAASKSSVCVYVFKQM